MALGLLLGTPLCPSDPAHTDGARTEAMSTESLDSLLARARERNGHYSAPSPEELERTGRAASTLLTAISGQKPLDAARRALAAERFELVETRLGDAPAVAMVEESAHRRGRGLYVFRTRDVARERLVQVPHSFFDEGTLPIGREIAERGARALFVNTVHRYPDGIPPVRAATEDEPGAAAAASPSDLAHQPASVFQTMTLATLQRFPETLVLQLHGFADRTDPEHEKTAVVVSPSIAPRGETVAQELAARLTSAFPELETRLYPRDVRVLGATTNLQAALVAKHPPARFIHVEMAKSLRSRLVAEPQLMRRFVTSVWGGLGE